MVPARPPELENAAGFGFKTKTKNREKRRIVWRNSAEKYNQDYAIGAVLSLLNQLSSWPCEASISISVTNGTIETSGEIRPYDDRAREISRDISVGVQQSISRFAVEYPKSSFSVFFKQEVEITKITKVV